MGWDRERRKRVTKEYKGPVDKTKGEKIEDGAGKSGGRKMETTILEQKFKK